MATPKDVFTKLTCIAIEDTLKTNGYILTDLDWDRITEREFIFRIRGVNKEPMAGVFILTYHNQGKIEAIDCVTKNCAKFVLEFKQGDSINGNDYYQFLNEFAKKVQTESAYIKIQKESDYTKNLR
ncbi:MAG: hypothetical protein J6B20_02325 [Clostridia bacterium]|nr:hypothetical protein [Clostridia bacterium]